MKPITLAAKRRPTTGKRATKALRREGAIPVALYGPDMGEARSLSVDRRELEKILHSHATTLLTLDVEGDAPVMAVLKAHQEDPVRGHSLHADFYQVTENHLLHTVIEVEVTGNSAGVKAGGILERPIREVEIECYPRDLPEHMLVDVTALDIGDSIHVGDLELPDGVTIRSPEPNTTLVHVVMPRAVVAEEAAAEAEEGEAEAPEGGEGAAPAADAAAEGGGEG